MADIVDLDEYRWKKLFTQLDDCVKILSDQQQFASLEDLDAFLEMLNLTYINAHEECAMPELNKEQIKQIVEDVKDTVTVSAERITMRHVVEIERRVYDELAAANMLSPEAQIYADQLIEEITG